MNLLKFSILNLKDDMPSDLSTNSMLINLDHIVSVKPINIVLSGNVIRGFWVRLSNGKKYKALKIPELLLNLFGTDSDEDIVNTINIGNGFSEELGDLLQ